MNSFATSDAPPIRPPSTSGMAKIAAAFCAFTLPPYRIRCFREHARAQELVHRLRLLRVALRPVPIAQTGSYASTALPKFRLLQDCIQLSRHHFLGPPGLALLPASRPRRGSA